MSNNDYLSWFFKYDGKTVENMSCHVEKYKAGDAKIHFSLREPGKHYTFAINFIDAVSADGDKAIPSYGNESEVDAVFNGWVRHVRNLFDAR